MKKNRSEITKKELTEKQYWESIHKELYRSIPDESTSKIKRIISRLFLTAPWNESQSDQHRWRICDRYLTKDQNSKLIEVGCAPGRFLIGYHMRYSYDPWGIDYSHEGVMRTRTAFESVGLDPSHIFLADFFFKRYFY